MDLNQYDLEIKRHAFTRAMERNVTPDMIEATLRNGKIEGFGKHNIKFIKDYKQCTVVCIGQVIGNKIKIFTIETKGEIK